MSRRNLSPAEIEDLCDWKSNFNGARKVEMAGSRGRIVSKRVSHHDYHFGYVCPYRVIAEIARGRPDPRRTILNSLLDAEGSTGNEVREGD